jgi:hypothetical protein
MSVQAMARWLGGAKKVAPLLATLAMLLAMLLAYAGAASAQSQTTLTSTVKQSGFSKPIINPAPINGSPYDYSGQDYASLGSLDQVSITLTIFDGDTAVGDGNLARDQLTLGLDGIDTGIKLNDFPSDQTTTQTITGVPNNAADILTALKADGQLNATVIDHSLGLNFLELGATFDTTLELVGTAAVPTTTEDCKNNGWKNFENPDGSPMFKKQGDCVSYVAAHGKNEPGQNVPGPKPM